MESSKANKEKHCAIKHTSYNYPLTNFPMKMTYPHFVP